MSQPFIGEIRIFAGNFAPVGWALCWGQMLPISENDALFQLIGTTYGGDGEQTFALPDLRGRIPIHQGQGPGGSQFTIGETGGVEAVTLTQQQIPAHRHTLVASSNSADPAVGPDGGLLASGNPTALYEVTTPVPPAAMNAAAISTEGGSQPHDNMAPYLCVNFIISLFGIFPSPS